MFILKRQGLQIENIILMTKTNGPYNNGPVNWVKDRISYGKEGNYCIISERKSNLLMIKKSTNISTSLSKRLTGHSEMTNRPKLM